MSARAPTVPFGLQGNTKVGEGVEVPATLADLDSIMEIEHASFPIPWSKNLMGQEIAGRDWSRVAVATIEERIVGFMVYWIVVTEVHLLNFAVHPTRRRHRVGKTMLHYLLKTMSDKNLSSIILGVRVSNTIAQRLYRSFGFTPISRRAKYYSDNDEDAIVMSLRRS